MPEMKPAIGFFVDADPDVAGVGFANPKPLPQFRESLKTLTAFRRSIDFSRWDRVTLSRLDMEAFGADFRATEVFSDFRPDRIELNGLSFDYKAPGFTTAFAFRWAALPDDESPIVTDLNWQPAEDFRGFRMRTKDFGVAGTESRRIGLQFTVGNDEILAQSSTPLRVTADPDVSQMFAKHVFCFFSWDGQTARIFCPVTGVSDSDAGSSHSAEAPVPDAGFRVLQGRNPTSGTEVPDGHGLAAMAIWSEGLDMAAMSEEHEKLKAWASDIGLDLEPEVQL